ncbi:MAG: DUF3891 family protein [Bacteroidota bacterium]
MILQRTPDGVFAIKQEDHAAFAGFLLEHWSDHNFLHDEEREQIILATCQHDNGWKAFDAAPALDPATGLPLEFTQVSAEDAFDIWMSGARKYIDTDPFVALLITHHAYSIHEQSHKRDPVWKLFFTEFAQLRAELRNRLGLAHPQVERAYSYLRMMDWFSLNYCMHYDLGAEKSDTYAGYNFKRLGSEFLFRPYPFDTKEISYSLPMYPMAEGGYGNEEELKAALSAPPIQQPIILNPLGRREK